MIPRGPSWKHRVCAELGWPHEDQADVARGLAADPRAASRATPTSNRTARPVEELIDFVTAPA